MLPINSHALMTVTVYTGNHINVIPSWQWAQMKHTSLTANVNYYYKYVDILRIIAMCLLMDRSP